MDAARHPYPESPLRVLPTSPNVYLWTSCGHPRGVNTGVTLFRFWVERKTWWFYNDSNIFLFRKHFSGINTGLKMSSSTFSPKRPRADGFSIFVIDLSQEMKYSTGRYIYIWIYQVKCNRSAGISTRLAILKSRRWYTMTFIICGRSNYPPTFEELENFSRFDDTSQL